MTDNIFDDSIFDDSLFDCGDVAGEGVFDCSIFDPEIFDCTAVTAISGRLDFRQNPNAITAKGSVPQQQQTIIPGGSYRIAYEPPFRTITGSASFEQAANAIHARAKLRIKGNVGFAQSVACISSIGELYNTDEETVMTMLLALM